MWKGFAVLCATLVSFSQGFGPLVLVSGVERGRKAWSFTLTFIKAPTFGDYIQAFNRDLKMLFSVLVQLFWCLDLAISSGRAHPILRIDPADVSRVPIQICFGRRPLLIASTLICFGSSLWRAKTNPYNSFMGACV